jgi:hypothetical protein
MEYHDFRVLFADPGEVVTVRPSCFLIDGDLVGQLIPRATREEQETLDRSQQNGQNQNSGQNSESNVT